MMPCAFTIPPGPTLTVGGVNNVGIERFFDSPSLSSKGAPVTS